MKNKISLIFLLFFQLFSGFLFSNDLDVKQVRGPKNPKMHVFIHVCTINNWKEVLARQLNRIKTSGLYTACDSISIGVLGTEDVKSFQKLYPKVKVLFQNSDKNLYERPTLLKLHEFCLLNPENHVVLYLHSKGITHLDNPVVHSNVNEWARFMEYFLIDRWQHCIRALRDYDTCGVNWNAGFTPPFFEGNFWWATSKHISTLPKEIGDHYMAPELWIGTNFPKAKSFHQSGLNHYAEPYPESRYIIQKK